MKKLIREYRAAPKKAIVPGIVILALILLAFLPGMTKPYTTIMLGSVIMYVILSLCWNMFSGATGYISLATAAFFGLGVYTSAILGEGLPMPVLMLLGGLAACVLAVLIGLITLRLRGVYFTIFTLGVVKLLETLILYLEIHLNGTRGRFVVSYSFNAVFYALYVLLILLLIAIIVIRRSRFGKALTCIAEGEDAAQHIGINSTRVKILSFAVSSFAMGAAGAAMATRWTYIDPGIAFNANYSFLPVLMVIFGGSQNLLGPMIGAAVFAYLQELLTTKFPYIYMLAMGVIMIAAILFMPRGILGVVQDIAARVRKRKEAKRDENP
ncbi:MAG: branched-chain amino acid ABC transporter permease [Oscillospiraceae bacterium]|nr:branched-chain amino acid ABC transporter permease [Oscillospiraceae bacterium]